MFFVWFSASSQAQQINTLFDFACVCVCGVCVCVVVCGGGVVMLAATELRKTSWSNSRNVPSMALPFASPTTISNRFVVVFPIRKRSALAFCCSVVLLCCAALRVACRALCVLNVKTATNRTESNRASVTHTVGRHYSWSAWHRLWRRRLPSAAPLSERLSVLSANASIHIRVRIIHLISVFTKLESL